jgi:acetolactate synthase I/II/III large subunit
MTKTVTQQILEALAGAGVDRIFGIPGGGPTADLVSLAPEAGIEFVLNQHETSAVIMAGLYGQRKGTVGVVVSAIGPGVANLANGVAHAYLDRLPVLLIADRYSNGVHDVALRQRFNHLAFMNPITKDQLVLHEDTFMTALRRAVRTALSDRQGPVFLDFPGNVANKVAPAQVANLRKSTRNDAEAIVREENLRSVATRLSAARNPLILAGLGALTLPAGRLGALAATLRAPVLTSPKAKGAIAGDDPWCAGVFMGGKLEQELLERADAIFFMGYDPVELLPRPWSLPTFSISLDSVPNTEQTFHTEIELTGKIADGVARLTEFIADAESNWTPADIADYKRHVIEAIEVAVPGFSPNQVVRITREVAPRETVLVTDVGANKLIVVELWEAYGAGDFLMSNGLATMGFCVPAAQAVKLAEPTRPVVCLCGDAGFLMRLPELLTGLRRKLSIVYVIFADDELSLISVKQVMKGKSKYGLDFPRPNYVALAEGFGMRGTTVSSPDEYWKALSEALAHAGSTLIEARIDNSGYVKQFDAIREL